MHVFLFSSAEDFLTYSRALFAYSLAVNNDIDDVCVFYRMLVLVGE